MDAKTHSLAETIKQARQGSKHQVEWSRIVNRMASDKGLEGRDRAEFIKASRED